MGTFVLIVFKFSTSSTTNHFSVFPTELAILHVHRFGLSGSTLGEEILAGRKFGGNKIWRNWREFNLADAKKY